MSGCSLNTLNTLRTRHWMEPVRIFSTRPVKFEIYAGWPVTHRPGRPIFFTEGLCSVFNKPNDKLQFTPELTIFFQLPIETLSLLSAPLSKIFNYSTPYCTSTMAYGVTCYSFLFFIDRPYTRGGEPAMHGGPHSLNSNFSGPHLLLICRFCLKNTQ